LQTEGGAIKNIKFIIHVALPTWTGGNNNEVDVALKAY